MTAGQLDLFGQGTEARRLVDGLTCLRDAVPDAMYVVIHLGYWLPRDERNIGASGDWAYSIRRDGLHFEHENDWWRGAWSRGERYGWSRTPVHRITWAELAEEIGGDPRRADLVAWSGSLTEPAWKERGRPHELWPDPGQWHPDYITHDHQHPGWDRRIAAWRTLQTILTDAITRLVAPLDLETTS
jgi:hypothetical protein